MFAAQGEKAESLSYSAYREQYASAEYPKTFLSVAAGDHTAAGASVVTAEYEGQEISALSFQKQGDFADFPVQIDQAGFYQIFMQYQPLMTEKSLIKPEFSIALDGSLPFEEAGYLSLDQPWANASVSENGQELPRQTALQGWTSMLLQDPEGRSTKALYFYFPQGSHKITLTHRKGAWLLREFIVLNHTAPHTYTEQEEEYAAAGYGDGGDFYQLIQAEGLVRKSDSTIMPDSDPSDPATLPNSPSEQLMNYIPGARYKKAGQWIEWEVTVPRSGLFQMDMRVRQDMKNGLVSTRRLLIDGKVPFEECENLQFPYAGKWYLYRLGTENEPYRFYLNEGTHTLRLEVTPGVLIENYTAINSYIDRLNTLYRKVVAITGFSADQYRTYNLKKAIPGLQDELESLREGLEQQKSEIIAQNGKAGEQLSSLQALINLLKVFRANPDKLALKLDAFKGAVESLSAWNSALNEQPLDVDYIRIYGADAKLPSAKAGFFENILFGVRRLLSSFFLEYRDGTKQEGAKSLSVWLSSGRDQLRVLKNLVQSDFEASAGAAVQLSIATDITSAVMAGKAPDTAIFLPGDDPVRLGCRNALADLSTFEGFAEVKNRFSEQALVPAVYKDAVYGLPITEVWPMMFIRNDILEEYGLTPPQTWDEMFAVAAVLQRNNIDIGIPSNTGMFLTLLLQNGGSVYTEDHMVAFDQQASIDGFQMWTDFFTKYSFPLSYDFYNRFRSGEMAIGITDYTMYAQLQIAAPEIKGKWSMVQLPGIRKEDGSINRSVSICGATGITVTAGLSQTLTYGVIFKAAKNPKTAWAFLDWLTGTDTQTRYGNDIEAQLGPAGRHATANREALARLPWDENEAKQLNAGMDSVVAVQELPGTYYIAREINNVFRAVLYKGAYPVDALCQHTTVINRELARKYKQFDIE